MQKEGFIQQWGFLKIKTKKKIKAALYLFVLPSKTSWQVSECFVTAL